MENDKTTGKSEEADLLYNTRSEEAQEIIGRMPHWIITWGITIMAGFMLLLLIISAAIKYPETISSQVHLSPLRSPSIIFAKTTGVIKQLLITDSQLVSKDQQLALAVSDSSGEIYSIKAPVNGKAVFVTDLKTGISIQKREPVFAIIPADFNPNEVVSTGMINAANKNSIQVGQTVDIELSNYPSETYGRLRGTIYKIAPVAVDDYYMFNIAFEHGLVTTNNHKISVAERLSGVGSIIVKDKTILSRLFEKLKAI
jgi:multidrug efflux pump subunit AcrA (membrane-fusion protein)